MPWNLDSAHTQIHFSVRHMMISTVRGKFEKFEAEAEIDPKALDNSVVKAKAHTSTIQTGDPQRDGHLKSADFFDAENHETIDLNSTKVTTKGDKVEVAVDLTIKNVTKPVTLRGEVLGPMKDPWGKMRVGFSVHGEINREDFGLTWNQALEAGGVLVGKTVKLEIDAQFVEG